ncbi:MAG: CinA family nicotinamide mononucleotide deamidase-related protein [candidate division KSB1 bacterium]|jgi:nicotinamide-nucleotide amidase|nr:CinA family nicotinamide mononucleotide deamidase-related protein [candidate division KSB1 bacterium]
MIAEIVSIGDEILVGQTINTNAAYIGKRLQETGVEVKWMTAIGDNEADLITLLKYAEERSDVIIFTGGLGPTHDDMTKNVFAKYFHSHLKLNEQILKNIKDFFDKRGVEMPKINEEQAMIPDNAIVFENENGTAPGLFFKNRNAMFFVLPGVPLEMKAMIDTKVIPLLKDLTNDFIRIKKIKTFGIGESSLFEKLGNIQDYERFVKVAFLPKIEGVEMRLTATALDEKTSLRNIEQAESMIRLRVGDYIWGVDDDTIEERVSRQLLNQDKRVSLVESVTGGKVVDKLSNHSDSSQFMDQGMVFSNERDALMALGLDKLSGMADELEIVSAIASRAREQGNSDYGVATSGLASTESKDTFGYVNVAIVDENSFHTARMILKRDRQLNKARAANFALYEFLRFLMQKNKT